MWKFKSMVDTLERLIEFKRVHEILEDFKVRYCPKSENVGRSITQKDPLLPYIDVQVKGYILSLTERAQREEGRRRSNSPPPFIPTNLRVMVAVPAECSRHRRRRKMGNSSSLSPPTGTQELKLPTTFPTKGTTTEMSYKRTCVTLGQILATPLIAQVQNPPIPQVKASTAPVAIPTTWCPLPHTEDHKADKNSRGAKGEVRGPK
nr:hypothetical protein CFP56_05042 [Quercus suber]